MRECNGGDNSDVGTTMMRTANAVEKPKQGRDR